VLEVELRAEEAACLAAEVLAYEFTATSRDPMQPVAHAVAQDDGSWLVRYERGASGPFLPCANGRFDRERPAAGGELTGTPPLGRIRFVAGPPLAPPLPVHHCVSIEITPISEARSRLVVHGRDPVQSAALFDLLVFVADLRQVHELVRAGRHDAAGTRLAMLTTAHRLGFSALHDPILAQAWTLRARLELETEQPQEARRSLAQARLLTPDAAQLALLQARLHERFAEPEQAKQSLVEAADLGGGVEAWSRAAAFVARGVEPATTVADRFRVAMEHSTQALERQDVAGAAAWAHRALDFRPGNAEALARLAEAVQARGQARDARDLRLMALHGSPQGGVDLARALSGDESRRGDPALALRAALRRAEQWPELLTEASVLASANKLGWERTLRILRSEGFARDSVPLALLGAAGNDDRAAFVGRLLVLFARDSRPALPAERPSVRTEPAFGSSGLAAPSR
jgi:hypothetical protein